MEEEAASRGRNIDLLREQPLILLETRTNISQNLFKVPFPRSAFGAKAILARQNSCKKKCPMRHEELGVRDSRMSPELCVGPSLTIISICDGGGAEQIPNNGN